MKIFTRMNISK